MTKAKTKSLVKKTAFRLLILLLLLAFIRFSANYLNQNVLKKPQTEIIAEVTRLISNSSTADYIFLRNPPKSSQGIIDWWVEHRQLLADDYNISKNKERMLIFIWDATKGFRETDEHDFFSTANLHCFDAFPSKENCLDFDYLILRIITSHDGIFIFETMTGEKYRQHPGEEIKKTIFTN
ncbi:hypothetical protein AAEX37_00649 [Oligella sp. MSHR50489EDL]|uniref:DUF943 family protein n=1 Tax=Oligella sp. MSHR50489EDL TaxID=3139409 RepID=UPI003D8167B1